MERILIIDDEKEIVELIRIRLTEAGYKVYTAYDGRTGLELVREKDINLVILDVMMPGMDGYEVCEQIRLNNNVPIIMVSAKGQNEDKIKGLCKGSDDYMVKPFCMEELLARVNSQIRRFTYFNSGNMKMDRIALKGVSIDEKQHKVWVYDQPVKLTPTEYEILCLFVKNPGQVFSSEMIYRKLWEEKYFEGNNTVMAHIWRLREKIEADPKNPKIIETVWGVGYKIEENEKGN